MFSFFFFKQKTEYEMRISDWSSDVCSSDLAIYSAGDGYTLFTYGDTDSAVSATVNQSISSPFVSFDLQKDDATKTVKIVAKRVGYATAATNPNAVSAANALDAL